MDLHFKKDGSLDMRYASSKAASGSSSSVSSPSSYVSSTPAPASYDMPSSDMHYKKDGSLDMRYTSSQAYMGNGGSTSGRSSYSPATSSVSAAFPPSPFTTASNDLHYKKDGSLDMRYGSSQAYVAGGGPASGFPDGTPSVTQPFTPKKDGTPDMRYNDPKSYVASTGENILDRELANMKITATPSTNLGKTKVVDGKSLPVKKDGTLDMRFKVNQDYAQKASVQETYNDRAREHYWDRLMQQYEAQEMWMQQQRERVTIPEPKSCFTEREIRSIRRDLTQVLSEPQSEMNLDYSVPANIQKIPDGSLDFSRATKELGKGAFGVVLQMNWQGKAVAVKKLYTDLTRNEKRAFQNEVCILAQLGRHTNLVEFYGYSIEPPCIVMELVELGSLNYLLHYCEDRKIELKIADGRVKKNLVIGIADGMAVLHEVGVVHGDLKPQNILVSKDWVAKITDFGLANLRGKASTMIQTNKGSSSADEIVGGTGGYMAPELLDYSGANPPSSDVYSFGIMLNEIVTEQEPYSDQYKNFAGRGANAAANYARLGNRPRVSDAAGSVVKDLIKACWDADGKKRPDFANIAGKVRRNDFVIPNGPRT